MISIVIVIVCQRSAVLLPPNMPNQSTKLLKAPAESSQFMRDSETVSLNMTNQPPRLAESNQFMRDSEKVSLNMTNHKHFKITSACREKPVHERI